MAESEVLDLEEGSGETWVTNNLCLVGKLIHTKILSASVISNILSAAWRLRSPFHVSDWNNNIFLFRFKDPEDKQHVMQEGPWSIMNNLLVLRKLEEGMVATQIDLSVCPFWVQIHGLPVEKMTRANAEIIGKRFGRILALETSSDSMLLSHSFLRVRVGVNIL